MESHPRKIIVFPVVRVFWNHAKRYPYLLATVFSAVVLVHVVQVAIPWYFKLFFDALAEPLPPEDIAPRLMAIFAIIMGLFL